MEKTISLLSNQLILNVDMFSAIQESPTKTVNDILLKVAPFLRRQRLESFASAKLLRNSLDLLAKDIMSIDKDALDYHKTRQLTLGLFALAQRNLRVKEEWDSGS